MFQNYFKNLGKVSITAHTKVYTLSVVEGLKGKFPKINPFGKLRAGRQSLSVLLIISLLLSQLTSLFVPFVYAATSPWSQTDWSGGSGQAAWSDATKFDSSSNVTTSTTGETTLSVAEKLTNTGFDSNNTSWSVAAVPPAGWVEVPGNATFSTTNFLVQKYEAKCAATSDPTTGLTTAANTYSDTTTACTSANSKQVVSVASGNPIVDITQANSITRCSSVSLGSTTAHLQTNNEWMSMTRDAEAQGANWNGGVVGTSYMFSGHNDDVPSGSQVASTDDTLGYTNTSNSAPSNQKRTLTLSNGSVIWDISGNVWERTNDVQSSTINTVGSQVEWNSGNIAAGARDLHGPSSASYLSAQGMGKVFGGSINNVFLRGGQWNEGANVGAFSLGLHTPGTSTYSSVGFRCASDPVGISQAFSSTSGRSSGGGNSVAIGSVSDGKVYQSVNAGDTSTYNISAYVYNNTSGSIGGTVDSNVAQLYYGGNTITSPAWTPVSGETGWYKLTGTVTGVASGIDTGVLVKADKTVIVDDVSLSKYSTSGTLTSSIFDTEFTVGAAWDTLTYTVTTPTNTTATVKVRTSNSSSMTGATDFSSCTAITSGSDISSNGCVTDSHRYIQYLLTLSNSSVEVTPTFSDISIAFATFDTDAPSISLTALTPDPNSDNTPTLSGTATESVGTVSNVQFQMDSTSGSWSSCTATDGSFNSASEAFSCTAATLTDGSHTMYVRATDSNGNTTSSSYASDAFTIDATNPVSIDLDSPGDNSYTNSERSSFKWKATTDATAGLSKYVLEIDNPSAGSGQASGDFTIDNIPTSGTTDITSNNKYVIHFDGFSDSDTTNNYISVYTRSTNDWGSSENDGKLREGRVSWKVKAIDNAGNETSSSRTLFIDRTNPTITTTQINSTPCHAELVSASTNQIPKQVRDDSCPMTTTDKTPTIYGKITDSLSGGDSGQSQNDSGPKVASGPKEVNIKVEKKNGLTYSLVTLYKINMDNPYYTCEPGKTIDNSKQKCDKYLPFEYTPKENLELGTYKITLSGKDKADNSSSETTLTLNITTLSQITTQLKTTSEESLSGPTSEVSQPSGEAPVPDADGNITIPIEPNALEKATTVILSGAKDLISNVLTFVRDSSGFALRMTTDGLVFIFNKSIEDLALKWSMTEQGLSFTYYVIASASEAILNTEKIATSAIGNGFLAMTNRIGHGYNNIAEHAPGVTKNILLTVGNGVTTVGTGIGNGFSATSHVIASANEAISNTGKIATSSAYGGLLAMTKGAQNGITSIAFAVGEKVQDVSGGVGIAIIKFTYNFVPEPTKISDVKVLVLSPTSVKVSWLTNHPANGKVNYGLEDGVYKFETQTDKRTTHHEFILTNLNSNTQYHYEVMSQNKNYVYDANRKFTTPAK